MTKSTGQRRRWTEEETAFVKANPQMPLRELQAQLGRCKSSLNKLRTRLGIYSDFHTPWSEEEKQVARDNLHLSNKKLAALLKRSASSVGSMRYHHDHRMQRTCIMCGQTFVSRSSNTKVCQSCNPGGKRSNNSPMVRLSYYVHGAKGRGLSFELTPAEFYSFWKKPCTYCGSEIPTIGLDRVDPTKGYLLDNVVPCCARCNEMKNSATTKNWIADMKRVLKHLGEL